MCYKLRIRNGNSRTEGLTLSACHVISFILDSLVSLTQAPSPFKGLPSITHLEHSLSESPPALNPHPLVFSAATQQGTDTGEAWTRHVCCLKQDVGAAHRSWWGSTGVYRMIEWKNAHMRETWNRGSFSRVPWKQITALFLAVSRRRWLRPNEQTSLTSVTPRKHIHPPTSEYLLW